MVKRYEINYNFDEQFECERMVEDVTGEYVRYDDIKHLLNSAQQTRGKICSGSPCDYCENFDGEHCNTTCHMVVGAFTGRKLRNA